MGFDVQGGGSDLAFPHHEMGASHAQALTGEYPFAKAYVHAGMVALNGEKMSKSKGNLVFVSQLRRDGVDPAAIRLALLSHHYRADWEWTDAGAPRTPWSGSARWRAAVSRPDGPSADALVEEIREALADDLDAPAALAAVDRWAALQQRRRAARTRARPAWSRAPSTRCWASPCSPIRRAQEGRRAGVCPPGAPCAGVAATACSPRRPGSRCWCRRTSR